MSHYVDVKQLEDFSIVEFLARLGYHPVRKSGKNHFYHSMLRQTGKNTPSLAVWDAGNCWKDWGGAGVSGIFKGGIVQLGMAYWPELSYLEVLHKIREVTNLDVSLIPEYIPPKVYPASDKPEHYQWELVRIQGLGHNPKLVDYLQGRGVYEVAKDRAVEVYYRWKDKPENPKVYFAVGWYNAHDGIEFSNGLGFKSSIGSKWYSVIPGAADHVAVFEGYMDYLSWLSLQHPFETLPTVIVLNAISMAVYAKEEMKAFEIVDLYLDNDNPGKKCTQDIMAELPQSRDCSAAYAGFNDFNDLIKHLATSRANQHQHR